MKTEWQRMCKQAIVSKLGHSGKGRSQLTDTSWLLSRNSKLSGAAISVLGLEHHQADHDGDQTYWGYH